MHRIRSRLTFANVLSVIAVFVALGGTAAASVIITSNSQVASGTISGHNPPSGKHSNLIPGSVNGSDLAPDAVKGPKILNGSVGEADLSTAARGARAYGYFSNVLVTGRSKNVVAVGNPTDGIYCLKLAPSIDPTKATVIPSTEFGTDATSEGGDQVAHAEWYQAGIDCPSGRMEVRTYLDEQKTQPQSVTGCAGCTSTDTYRDLVRVDQGFSFVVP